MIWAMTGSRSHDGHGWGYIYYYWVYWCGNNIFRVSLFSFLSKKILAERQRRMKSGREWKYF